jgi:hypothetical protein
MSEEIFSACYFRDYGAVEYISAFYGSHLTVTLRTHYGRLGTSDHDRTTVHNLVCTDDPFVITTALFTNLLSRTVTRRFVRKFEYTKGFPTKTIPARKHESFLDPLSFVIKVKTHWGLEPRFLGEIQMAQLLCIRNQQEWRKNEVINSCTNLPKELSKMIFDFAIQTFSQPYAQIIPHIRKQDIDEQMYSYFDNRMEEVEGSELASVHLTDEAIKEHLKKVLLAFYWLDENGVETLWQRPIPANFTWSNAK